MIGLILTVAYLWLLAWSIVHVNPVGLVLCAIVAAILIVGHTRAAYQRRNFDR